MEEGGAFEAAYVSARGSCGGRRGGGTADGPGQRRSRRRRRPGAARRRTAACAREEAPAAGVEIGGRPLPRRRGPGVAVEEAEARRGVGAETEARRGGGAEAEWRPAAAAVAKSIWQRRELKVRGNGRGCVIYIGVPL